MNRARLLFGVLLIGGSFSAHAEYDPWALCPALPPPPTPQLETDDLRSLYADEAYIDQQAASRFDGHVELQEKGTRVQADHLAWDHSNDDLTLDGNVRVQQNGVAIDSDAGQYSLQTEQGQFQNVRFLDQESRLRGETDRWVQTSATQAELGTARLTTCPPGNEAWLLSGERVTLNRDSGRGEARNVVLRFQDIPILYSPWVSFPIDDRRASGFLVPSIGSSDRNGLEITTPYYVNLAANADATYTPSLYSEQGLLHRGELRYLHQAGYGEAQLEYLDEDQQTGEERYTAQLKHRSQLARAWRTDVLYNGASDGDYFNDFGNDLNVVNVTHLERRADLIYANDNTRARLRVQNYQTLDDNILSSDRPYQRLPQLLLSHQAVNGERGWQLDGRAEWVYFDRVDSVVGSRLDLKPSVGYRWAGPATYLEPRLAYRYTQYTTDDPSTGEAEYSRGLPITSLDAGVFLERPLSDNQWLSLEPRLYYLHVPFDDQSQLPVFDSSLAEFSFDQLFSDNRFLGADRQGDANQITTAATLRWLDSGRERLSVSLGQIHYLDAQRVDLNGNGTTPNDGSDLAAEIASPITQHWNWRNSLLWDPYREQTVRNSTQLQYRVDEQRVINLGHRLRENELEQAVASAAWPINKRWRLLGSWRYDLEQERDLELLTGLEYESCCWMLRAVTKRYVIDDGADYNNAIYLQLVLKGLGGLGSNLGQSLENDINGFESLD